MKKISKIPTILGIFILTIGLFAGVVLLKNNQIFKIGASPTITPKNVRVSNISDSSVTISWVTEDQTVDFISYGTGQDLNTVVYESDDEQKYFTHSITVTGLDAQTTYGYKINSDGTNFDNNGIPWQFTTGVKLSDNQNSVPVSGSVITASGQPTKRAIVYATVNGSLLSTLTSDKGSFIIQLGLVRSPDLASFAKIDTAKTLIEISVESDTGETTTAKIFPQAANPIPALIIGQDKDYRSLQPTTEGKNPNADLNLPAGATAVSKLNVTNEKVTQSKNVTLDSLTDGESVSTDKPEFFGDGPVGTEVTISVHSDTPITGTTTVSSKGSWNWSPPDNLSPGAHTVTVSWIDASGITRTLTRNFVVQASELPAFVSTPSATPTKSPSSSPTPKPTGTATATPKPTPTTTLAPKPTATPASLPQSGTLTPTLILFIMSLGVLTFSYYIWKASEQ